MKVTQEMIDAFGEAWNAADGAENVMNCHEHDMGDCPYHKTPGARRRAGLQAALAVAETQPVSIKISPRGLGAILLPPVTIEDIRPGTIHGISLLNIDVERIS
jgi:hypothetical protein